MDMQGRVAAKLLGCVFDDEAWSLDSVVRCDVAPGGNSRRAAPREPGVVDIGFDLGHTGASRAFVDYAHPFGDDIEQHAALPLVHAGGLQAFGLNSFAVLTGPEHQIRQAEAEYRLLALALVECVQQGYGLVA